MFIKIINRLVLKILSILILLQSFIINSFLFGQTYSFKIYSNEEGLAPISLNIIFQDSRGILWFGGIGGLSKYDGFKFKYFFKDLNSQIIIKDIKEDSKNILWIATEGNGVIKINTKNDSVTNLSVQNKKIPTNNINKILFDKYNNTWLGTDVGILIITSNGSIKKITKENGLHSDYVNNLIIDSSGTVWVSDGGLAKIIFADDDIKSIERIYNFPLISLSVGRNNSIFFGTIDKAGNINTGVFKYKNGKYNKILNPDDYNIPIKPQAILETNDGNVWVGTTRGCFIISPEKIFRINSKNGLLNENVSSIIKDKEGTIWIATGKGAYKLIKRNFINFTENDRLISSGILTGVVDSKNNAWFGGWSGLYKIDPNFNLKIQGEVCYSNYPQVHSLLRDNNNTIWIGRYGGLSILKNNSLHEFDLKKKKSDVFVTALTTDSVGNIYVGMIAEIIVINKNKILKCFNKTHGLLKSNIISLVNDKARKLWFSQNSYGCGYIKNNSVKYFTIKDGLPSNNVNSIFIDSQKRIWAATTNGLALFNNNNNSFTNVGLGSKNSLHIRSLNEDANGHIWIGTDLGVYEWNDSVVSHFDSRDGLAGDIIHSILIDKNKNILFGTNSGISIMNYNSLSAKIPVPNIWIEVTSLSDENKIYHNVSKRNYNQNSIQFKLVSPSFHEEYYMEFSYKLIGFENNWSSSTNQRIVRYISLEPGKYTFMAKAKNRNGQWSSAAVYNFEITPPYWQKWWFRVLVAAMIISYVLTVYKRRVNYLRKENESQQRFSQLLIESQEAERKRIASELHDGLGQELLTIINRAKITIKKPDKYPPLKQLQSISDSALNSIEEVRRIARNLHPYQLDSLGLTSIISDMLDKFKNSSEIQVDYSIFDIDNLFTVEKEISIYRIIQECLNNIIKHSNADIVTINIDTNFNQLKIFITDNGIGIPLAKQQEIFHKKTGFGLWGIKERIKYLNGTFNLESSENKGTEISIIIPIEKKDV